MRCSPCHPGKLSSPQPALRLRGCTCVCNASQELGKGTVSRFDHDACALRAQAPPTTLRLRGCTCACNASGARQAGHWSLDHDACGLAARGAAGDPPIARLHGACKASRELGTRDSRSLDHDVRPWWAQAPPTRAMGRRGASGASSGARRFSASPLSPFSSTAFSRRRRHPVVGFIAWSWRHRRSPARRRLTTLACIVDVARFRILAQRCECDFHRWKGSKDLACARAELLHGLVSRLSGAGSARATRVRDVSFARGAADRLVALVAGGIECARARGGRCRRNRPGTQYELATLAASAPLVDRQSERGRARLARSQAERAPRRRMIRRWLARGAAWRGSARGGGRRLIEVVAPRAGAMSTEPGRAGLASKLCAGVSSF